MAKKDLPVFYVNGGMITYAGLYLYLERDSSFNILMGTRLETGQQVSRKGLFR